MTENHMEVMERVMQASLNATLPYLFNNVGIVVNMFRVAQDDFTFVYGESSGINTAEQVNDSVLTVSGTPTNDIVTTTYGESFPVDTQVKFATDDTLPAGLVVDTEYWIVSSVFDDPGATIQVSTAKGGTAISITDSGTGIHTATSIIRALITNMTLSPIDIFMAGAVDMAYLHTTSEVLKVGDVIGFVRLGDNRARRYKINSLEGVGSTRAIFTRYKMSAIGD